MYGVLSHESVLLLEIGGIFRSADFVPANDSRRPMTDDGFRGPMGNERFALAFRAIN